MKPIEKSPHYANRRLNGEAPVNTSDSCHIGWHTLEGLAVQFVERRSEIDATLDFESMNSTCAKWNTYNATSATYVQTDSGI
jgi:hypothetical protein